MPYKELQEKLKSAGFVSPWAVTGIAFLLVCLIIAVAVIKARKVSAHEIAEGSVVNGTENVIILNSPVYVEQNLSRLNGVYLFLRQGGVGFGGPNYIFPFWLDDAITAGRLGLGIRKGNGFVFWDIFGHKIDGSVEGRRPSRVSYCEREGPGFSRMEAKRKTWYWPYPSALISFEVGIRIVPQIISYSGIEDCYGDSSEFKKRFPPWSFMARTLAGLALMLYGWSNLRADRWLPVSTCIFFCGIALYVWGLSGILPWSVGDF